MIMKMHTLKQFYLSMKISSQINLFCHFIMVLTNRNKILTLRKLAHAIYREFFTCKNRKFHQKKNDIFIIFAQNINCWLGGSYEYPQSMFWCKNNKNRYTPAYPSFAK